MEVDSIIQELEKLGYFKDQKLSGRDLMVTCPFHNHGTERKPSFGINLDTGACHCFTCEWGGGINKLSLELTGKSVSEHTKYNIKTTRKEIPLIKHYSQKYIPISTVRQLLKNNTPAITYLESRGITTDQFPIGYNKQHNSLVLFIRNLNGDYIYTKERCIHEKRFYNTTDANRAKYLFGLYECVLAGATTVWLCESEIDALTVWSRGSYAVATGSSAISKGQVRQLQLAGVRTVVDGLDRDIAGRQGWLTSKEILPMQTIETEWGNNKKDINETSLEEFSNIVLTNKTTYDNI